MSGAAARTATLGGMSTSSAIHRTYSFGEFTLDLDRGSLIRAGEDIKLRPKCFDVLSYLVERQGLLVTKDELLDAVWGGAVVTEDSITHCVIDIRRALRDQSHQIIRTIPRRGYIFDVPVTKHGGLATASFPPSRSKFAPSRLRWPLDVAFVLVLGVAAVWWWFGNRGNEVAVTVEPQTFIKSSSIAVLPFLDMSPEQDQGFFADGISEDILNLLAKNPNLKVISRSSAFAFKGENIDTRTVAQRLRVAFVLEGSVRRIGKQLRITAHLIEASSDTQLWSETYDHRLGNVFHIQDEIAAEVADALNVELLGAVPRTHITDHEVYMLVLQANFFWNRKSPGDVERAADYYQRALNIDPSYAPAWVGISASYLEQVDDGRIPFESGLAKAWEAAEMALSLDPDLSDAHARLGILHMYIHNREAALKEYEKALALNPNNPLAMAVMGSVWTEGRLDEAINWYKKAAAVDPLTTTWPNNMAVLLIRAGRLDEAEEAVRRAIVLSRSAPLPLRNLAVVFCLRGEYDEALELIRSLQESAQNTLLLTIIYHAMGRHEESDAAVKSLASTAGKEDPLLMAQAHAFRGEADKAFEWLDKTNDTHHIRFGVDMEFAEFEFDPFLDNLHADARWDALHDKLEVRH